jgi:predicted GIY-YIG superfamily endonuclease
MATKLKNKTNWYVYAIECENNSVYIGQTHDVMNRWRQHLSGRGAEWTKKYKPVRLFYTERLNSLKKAMSREKELKTSTGRRMLKKKLLDYLGSNLSAGQAGAGEQAEELLRRILEEKTKLEAGKKANKKKRLQNTRF